MGLALPYIFWTYNFLSYFLVFLHLEARKMRASSNHRLHRTGLRPAVDPRRCALQLMEEHLKPFTVIIYLFMFFFCSVISLEAADSKGSDSFTIRPNGIIMPKGRMLLLRRSGEYGAIKVIDFSGKPGPPWFADYESYYQGDQSGDFTRQNIQVRKERVSLSRTYGIALLGLGWAFGKYNIECGSIKLLWTDSFWVGFFSREQDQGDYGIEFSPTKWTDLSQVNVFDPRLKWYRYDTGRQTIQISVDQLWDE
jgi:hypothetical protein